MPTPGSTAGLKSLWPTPRIDAVIAGPNIALDCFSVTFGAWLVISLMFVCERLSSMPAEIAVIASGVSCTFCSRNCAVTTTSSIVPSSAAGSAAHAPATIATPADAARTRATVRDTVERTTCVLLSI